jgi:hypothetical protein
MTTTMEMIRTHPITRPELDSLVRCIEACFDCAQVCTTCADACLGEPEAANLVRCIRINLDCANICQTTGEVLSRQVEPDMGLIRAQLQACIEACRVCAEECDKHGMHMEHCRVCASVCRRCEEACRELMAKM